MDDQRIKDLLRARDEAGLSACSSQYGDACRRLAVSLLGDQSDAEEVVNDALLQVWNAIPPADPPSVRSFFALIVRRRAVDRLRENTRQKRGGNGWTETLEELSDVLSDPADGRAFPDDLSLKDALSAFLTALPTPERRLFLKRYWWFCSIREIAEGESLSQSAVKMRLSRTREKLARFLSQEGFSI